MELKVLGNNVQEVLESGVKPLELEYIPIINFDGGYPVAYRTETKINSLILGEMNESVYTYVADMRESGIELFKHMILRVIRAIGKFEKMGRSFIYISMRCPSGLVSKIDFYETLKEIIKENKKFDFSKLCFEFSPAIFNEDEEKAKTAFLDIKSLKIKTCITGCGGKDFPTSRLTDLMPDYVVLDSSATKWAGNRNKPTYLPSLVTYIMSMGISVVACGEEQNRKKMRGTDCVGFIDSNATLLTEEQAIAQKEEED